MIRIKVRIDYSDMSHKFYAETQQSKPGENFWTGNEIFENSYLFSIDGLRGFFLVDNDGYCVDKSCFGGCVDIVVISGKEGL